MALDQELAADGPTSPAPDERSEEGDRRDEEDGEGGQDPLPRRGGIACPVS